jgi:subtilase family serine protease
MRLPMKHALRSLVIAATAAAAATAIQAIDPHGIARHTSASHTSASLPEPGSTEATQSARVTALNALVLRTGRGIIHMNRTAVYDPPTTNDCRQQFQISCYDPAQVQQAYNLSPVYNDNIDGQGRTIVVVDVFGSPTIGSDLTQFDNAFGLPDPPAFRTIAPAGRIPGYDQNNADMVAWAGETTLDVEWAHAIATAANILLVEVPEKHTGDFAREAISAENYVVKHHLGDVISQSWGAAEQAAGPIRSLRSAYQAAAKNHITVLASTGDTGAANAGPDGSTYYTFPTSSWPATDPLVTAVGGTDLHLYATGSKASADTVWNDTYNTSVQQFIFSDDGPNPLATGGGKSAFFSRPSYQNGVKKVTGKARGVPDISMSGACADSVNVYQSYGGLQAGWYAVCGTSESTPLFAGIVALAAEKAGHGLGLINPAIYKLAAEHAPGIVEVTQGNNTVSFSQNDRRYTVHGYSARHGYSPVAGVGTINAQYFVPELAKLA